MSFKSRHMKHPVEGVRLLKNAGNNIVYLKSLTGKEVMTESFQHYGNTRFDDYQIMLAFMKCAGHISNSVSMVGYSGCAGSLQTFRSRMLRINTKDFLETVRIMMRVGHLTKAELQHFLKRDGYFKGPAPRIYINIGLAIILSSIKKYKGKKRAAIALGISLPVINKWLSCED